MAEGLLPLNFVVNEKILAFSETNPRNVLLPALHQEDIVEIKFKALRRVSDLPPFMEKLNLTGYALEVSVGTVGSVMASNSSWTLTDNGYALEGKLNLNTAAVLAALTSSQVQLIFEIILSTATVKYRLSREVIVKKSVSLAGALVPAASDTALGRLEAVRTYAPLENCPGIVFKDTVTGERMMLRISNGAPEIVNVPA